MTKPLSCTPRVLFFAQGVSLAHVARPSLLADALQAAGGEVHFASNGQYASCHANRPWQFHRIDSLSPQAFLDRLASGSPLCQFRELAQQVEQDLALMQRIRPDCVVGDFRLSLGISARQARVPLISLCNAYWSPFAADTGPPPAPDLPFRRLLGPGLAPWLFDPVFRRVWPVADRVHRADMNRLRRQHGLPPYRNLREMYCDGDEVLYADVPELSALRQPPAHHQYLGPLVWSPELALPAWWAQATQPTPETDSPAPGLAAVSGAPATQAANAPLAYVTLGSTGSAQQLPEVIAACRAAGLRCLVATAGRVALPPDPPGVYSADWLPGTQAAAAASLVVCNGGSPSAHQALACGRPVLGICSNIDQMLNMQQIAAAGAGAWLRAGDFSAKALAASLAQVRAPAAAQAARGLATAFAGWDASARFVARVHDVCS